MRMFVIIVFASLAASLLIFPLTMINGDEGFYVQDALLLREGKVPVADYSTRTPILMFLIWFFESLFGPSMLVYRLSIMVLTALTSGVIFLLGRLMFSQQVGILAAFLYAFNPYILWSGQVIKSEAVPVLCMVLALYFLVKGLKTTGNKFFILCGVCIGLAFIDRHSAAAYVLATGLTLLYWFYGVGWKQLLKQSSLMTVGFFIGFMPIFLWIASRNFENALLYWFGIAAEIFLLDRPSFLSATPLAQVSGPFSYDMLRSWALAFVEDTAIQAWIFFMGFVVFLLMGIQILFERSTKLMNLLLVGTIVIFMGALVGHALIIFRVGSFRPYAFLIMAICSVLFLLLILRSEVIKGILQQKYRDKKPELLVLGIWIVSLIIAYTFWRPGYIREFMPLFAIVTGVVIQGLSWQTFSRAKKFVLSVAIAVLFGTSVAWYQDPITGGWWWTQQTIALASERIQVDTEPNEEIFSANPLPVLIANRKVLMNLSSYSMLFARNADEHWGTYPSPRQVMEHLSSNPPTYAIVDKRMELHFFRSYPFFKNFIETNYAPVVKVGEGQGETQIWKLKEHL